MWFTSRICVHTGLSYPCDIHSPPPNVKSMDKKSGKNNFLTCPCPCPCTEVLVLFFWLLMWLLNIVFCCLILGQFGIVAKLSRLNIFHLNVGICKSLIFSWFLWSKLKKSPKMQKSAKIGKFCNFDGG